MTAVKAHAKFSASGSERWLNCQGSIHLSSLAPEPVESKYAIEGTRAHEVVELLMREYIADRGPESFAWSLRKKYPKAMIEHALSFIEDVDQRVQEAVEPEVLAETRVNLEFVEPGMFGTVDAAIVEKFGRLTVIDYKYGAGIWVDAEENSQLIYYALGIAHLYDYDFSEVMIVVNQPRAYDKKGPIREWLMPIKDLKAWAKKFKLGVKACKEVDKKKIEKHLRSGDWCKFCPAENICPEISNRALRKAQDDFDDL